MNRDEAREAAIANLETEWNCASFDAHEREIAENAFDAGYQAGSEGRLADEHRKVSEAYQHGYDDGEKEGYERAKQED